MSDTNEPLKLTMGDTWTWTRPGGDYPASAGWTLTYYLSTPGGAAVKTIVAAAAGGDFLVTVTAANSASTANWAPGLYNWFARVTKGTESYTVGSGKLRIAPDPLTAIATQTHAEKCLTTIEGALEKCLTQGDVIEYEIDGVKFKKNKTELLTLRNAYREEVRRERGQLGMRVIPVCLR